VADVLLTHSYHLFYDRKQAKRMQPYPPLGTLYAAAVLREQGVPVAVFDSMLNEPVEGFREALRRHRPKFVAIYEDDFNFLTKMCLTRMRELAWQMTDEARRGGARVVVHGSDATDHALEYLKQGAECVLIGEAEQTLAAAIRQMNGERGVDEIPGVATLRREARGSSGVKRTPRVVGRPRANLPMPTRDLIDMASYREAWHAAHGYYSANLVASRGCPFRCNWCAKPVFGDSFQSRPAVSVAAEMAELRDVYGAEHLWFADDIFGLNHHWLEEFATEVEARDCAVPFKVQARADLMRASTAAALRRAGCQEVWMGVESGSQKILNAMDKGLRVEEVLAAREFLKQEGIRACFFLQFGYPGESWSDLKQTIELVRQTRPDDIGISVSYPLPNTRFYERVQQQLGKKRNWADSEDLCVMFRGAYTDGFYRAVRNALHAEVDGWKNGEAVNGDVWRQIELLEPLSRNADATELWNEFEDASGQAGHPVNGFVSIRSAGLAAGDD
jgi:radical SAM superfamily enzyme YgiQ (UPF0313 family)